MDRVILTATEGFSKETAIKNTVKVGISVGFGEMGKAGVKATRTVAGKAAVDAGANIVSESIVQGTTAVGGKVADKMPQEIMKDKKKDKYGHNTFFDRFCFPDSWNNINH